MFKRSNPSWLSGAIFYEIYPQSFYDTNSDGIGDLPGIIEKLDYIESLGCNAIWIHPCFVSPFRDAGYDVADFCRIAPRYGTNADMKRLVKAAHKRGIKVCLDLVAGHTSTDHPWFQESCKLEPNEFTNRYIWTNSWAAENDGMPTISGYSQRAGAYVTNFFWAQPALNYGFASPDPKFAWQLPADHPDCLATREALKGIMRFWLDMGVDGYRVDMAPSLIKKPPQDKAMIELWQDIFSEIQTEYPESVWISEWFNNEAAIQAGYHVDFAGIFSYDPHQQLFRAEKDANLHYTPGHPKLSLEGDSFFSKNSKTSKPGKGDAPAYIHQLMSTLKKIEGKGYVGHYTSNHDITRIRVNRSLKELEPVFAFVLTAPGVPFIYYGDEIGMRYAAELPDKEGGYTRTGSRTPMQWTAGKNAGFSAGKAKDLYLPVDSAKDAPNVQQQEKDPQSLLHAVRKLVQLRRDIPAFDADGAFTPVLAEKNAYPLAYLRTKGDSRVLVVLNPSGQAVKCEVKVPSLPASIKPLLDKGVSAQPAAKGKLQITAKPVSYGIFEL